MPQPSSQRPNPQSRTRSQAQGSVRRASAPQSRSRAQQAARHARPQKRPPRRGPIIIVLVLLVLVIVGATAFFLTQCKGGQNSNQSTQTEQNQTQASTNSNTKDTGTTKEDDSTTKDSKAKDSDDTKVDKSSWELTLVNKTHPLPEDWDIELEEVYEGKYVDARIAEQFTQMIEDCRAAGYDDVFVNQAYRSHEDQQAIWDEFYNQYLAEGYSEEEAEQLTGESVAIPGTSEHELGLAADICSINFDEEYNAPIQTWLRENGYKYGFIQRYPEGKEEITGTKNENWHFRYVGVEAATQIHDSGQVLEEYLGEANSE